MAITSGFYNSVSGDRLYNAEEMTSYFEGLVSDGVYANVGEALIVRASGGMTVTVGTGRALVNMHWIKNSAALSFTVPAADVQYGRIDAIVIKSDATDAARAGTIEYKQGTPSASPMPPEYENTSSIKEMPIAHIVIPRNAAAISQHMIQDLRGSTLCGWVTGLIKQVDTSELFLQYQTAYENYYAESTAAFDAYFAAKQAQFESWFSGLTNTLGVNTELHKYQYLCSPINERTSPMISEAIGYADYEDGDILLVFVNGVYFTEGVDYVTSDNGAWHILFPNKVRLDDTITQILIKSEIGDGISGTAGDITVNMDGTAATAVTGDIEEV